jgi:hypothetical protein
MSKAIIEIVNDNGQLKYSVTQSGDPKIDQLAKVAIGTMGAYVKSGGNPQNLLNGLQGQAKNMLQGMFGNGMMGGML